jgi:hypothetical protein
VADYGHKVSPIMNEAWPGRHLCRFTLRFATQDGEAVSSNSVSLVTLRSSTGTQVTFSPRRTTWLACGQPVDSGGGLRLVAATDAVHGIVISGANAAKTGQSVQPGAAASPDPSRTSTIWRSPRRNDARR